MNPFALTGLSQLRPGDENGHPCGFCCLHRSLEGAGLTVPFYQRQSGVCGSQDMRCDRPLRNAEAGFRAMDGFANVANASVPMGGGRCGYENGCDVAPDRGQKRADTTALMGGGGLHCRGQRWQNQQRAQRRPKRKAPAGDPTRCPKDMSQREGGPGQNERILRKIQVFKGGGPITPGQNRRSLIHPGT